MNRAAALYILGVAAFIYLGFGKLYFHTTERISDMTLQQLKYFVDVAETLNFSETARRLYTAPSAISYGIATLEKELGVLLFDRRGSVTLTKEGTYLYLEAVRILKSVENIYQTLSRAETGNSNELKIGFLPSLLKPYFSELIVPFVNTDKKIKLSIHPMNLKPLMDSLISKEIDIALTRTFQIEKANDPRIRNRIIFKDRFSLLVYNGHPFSKQEQVSDLAMLSEDDFITVNPEVSGALYNKIIDISARRNYHPKIKYIGSNMDSVFTQVAAHMGISIVPFFNGFYAKMPEVCFIPIEGDDLNADIALAWMEENEKDLIAEFLKQLTFI